MLISFPRRPARNFSIISANSGWSCSWIRGTRAMDYLSLHFEAGRLHDRRPARKLLADELPRRTGARVEDRLAPRRPQEALNVRVRHDRACDLGDAVDGRLGDAGGSEETVEIAGDHPRQSGFDRGRNIGRRLDARYRVDGEDAHFAGAMEVDERPAHVRRHHRNMTAGEGGA